MNNTGQEPDKNAIVTASFHRKVPFKATGFILIVVIIIAGAGVIWWRHSHKKSVAVNTAKCSSTILKQAAANFDPSKFEALQKIATQIRAIPGYQQDANCMYVAVISDINITDSRSAHTDLAQLQKVYSTKTGYSKSLGLTKNMTTLQGDIVFMEKGIKQEQSQVQLLGNPK